MQITKHPAERLIDWMPRHTKLYIRGERGQDNRAVDALYRELFDQLAPFLEDVARRGLTWTGAPVDDRRALLEDIMRRFPREWFSLRMLGGAGTREDLQYFVSLGLLDSSKPIGGNPAYITYRILVGPVREEKCPGG